MILLWGGRGERSFSSASEGSEKVAATCGRGGGGERGSSRSTSSRWEKEEHHFRAGQTAREKKRFSAQRRRKEGQRISDSSAEKEKGKRRRYRVKGGAEGLKELAGGGSIARRFFQSQGERKKGWHAGHAKRGETLPVAEEWTKLAKGRGLCCLLQRRRGWR